MNKRLSVARGLLTIADLKPGSLFILGETIAVKTNKMTIEGYCECIVIGSGDILQVGNLNGDILQVANLNHVWVQPAILSDIPDVELNR